MANETNGGPVTSQDPAPAPNGTKPPKPKALSTQGRKPVHRSTKAELNRERLTAQVITCLVAGKTIEDTAAELDISITWVRRVKDELPEDFVAYFAQAKSNEISSLIEQGLRAQLLAMIKIVEVTNDELWLKAQRAPELATFFGVINDKTIRVLAAIERADERARIERESLSVPREGIPVGTTSRREPQQATLGA